MVGGRDVCGDVRVGPVVVDRTPSIEPIFRSRATIGKKRKPVGMNISAL
jgi:hypothetical protein